MNDQSFTPSTQRSEEDFRRSTSTFQMIEEVKRLYTIALPVIITGILTYGKSAISMYFLGTMGKEALAGGSLAIGLANISGYSVISGLAMGTEAISSQACGANKWSLMGKTLTRAIIILTMASIPISLFWIFSESVLRMLHQEPEISSIASHYLIFSLPNLFIQCLIHPLRIYLRTQNVLSPLVYGSSIALVMHGLTNYWLTYRLKYGIKGIALASGFTDFVLFLTILIYILLSRECRKSLQGFSVGTYTEWRSVLVLAIPSCVSVCLEWWWYEIMIFLCGILSSSSRESVATMGILIQLTSLLYIFPSALSQAVSTRVGNELGANRPTHAKKTSYIALYCAILTGAISMIVTIIGRNSWGGIFATDTAILSLTAACLPVVGLSEFGNTPQTTLCGVLRGSARPSLAARINLGAFYCVGLPVAVLMGFGFKLGLFGLMLGLLSAQLVCFVLMIVVLARTDWEAEARRARELTGDQSSSLPLN